MDGCAGVLAGGGGGDVDGTAGRRAARLPSSTPFHDLEQQSSTSLQQDCVAAVPLFNDSAGGRAVIDKNGNNLPMVDPHRQFNGTQPASSVGVLVELHEVGILIRSHVNG